MLFWGALIAVAAAVSVMLYTKKTYPVHSQGIVLITGASTGIGRHAAEQLANDHPGFLVLAGVRKNSDAESIKSLNVPNLSPLIIDVAKHESCVAAMDEVKTLMNAKNLPLIGLVNNAGISRRMPLEFHTIDDAKTVFQTNVFGLLDLTQLALPMLRESKGRIVMISSVSSLVSLPLSGIYSASKRALDALTDSLRRELAPFEVSVSVVQPAYVKTAIFTAPDREVNDVVKSAAQETYPKHYTEKVIAGAKKLYGMGDEPIVTTDAIVDALVSEQPKTRYVVANISGISAFFIDWFVWLISDRLEDFILS